MLPTSTADALQNPLQAIYVSRKVQSFITAQVTQTWITVNAPISHTDQANKHPKLSAAGINIPDSVQLVDSWITKAGAGAPSLQEGTNSTLAELPPN